MPGASWKKIAKRVTDFEIWWKAQIHRIGEAAIGVAKRIVDNIRYFAANVAHGASALDDPGRTATQSTLRSHSATVGRAFEETSENLKVVRNYKVVDSRGRTYFGKGTTLKHMVHGSSGNHASQIASAFDLKSLREVFDRITEAVQKGTRTPSTKVSEWPRFEYTYRFPEGKLFVIVEEQPGFPMVYNAFVRA